jgi:hypothetical protein
MDLVREFGQMIWSCAPKDAIGLVAQRLRVASGEKTAGELQGAESGQFAVCGSQFPAWISAKVSSVWVDGSKSSGR